jgi:hypothetical protein
MLLCYKNLRLCFQFLLITVRCILNAWCLVWLRRVLPTVVLLRVVFLFNIFLFYNIIFLCIKFLRRLSKGESVLRKGILGPYTIFDRVR